uniref:Uncharacterized protein n=1 Tax=Romanomermis culicivorax TaxID=13658 RepID=A0A915KIR4_ROMCU
MCRWTRRSKKRPSTGSTYKESIKSDTHDMELAANLISKHGFLNSPKRAPLIHNGSYPTCSINNKHQIMSSTCNYHHSKKLTSIDSSSLGSNRASYAKLNQQQRPNIVVVGALDKGGKMKMRKFDSMLPPAGGKKSAKRAANAKISNNNNNLSLSASSRHSLDSSTLYRSSNQVRSIHK